MNEERFNLRTYLLDTSIMAVLSLVVYVILFHRIIDNRLVGFFVSFLLMSYVWSIVYAVIQGKSMKEIITGGAMVPIFYIFTFAIYKGVFQHIVGNVAVGVAFSAVLTFVVFVLLIVAYNSLPYVKRRWLKQEIANSLVVSMRMARPNEVYGDDSYTRSVLGEDERFAELLENSSERIRSLAKRVSTFRLLNIRGIQYYLSKNDLVALIVLRGLDGGVEHKLLAEQISLWEENLLMEHVGTSLTHFWSDITLIKDKVKDSVEKALVTWMIQEIQRVRSEYRRAEARASYERFEEQRQAHS